MREEEIEQRILAWLEENRDKQGKAGTFRLERRYRPEHEDYELVPIAITPQGEEIRGEVITADHVLRLQTVEGNVSLIRDLLSRLIHQLPMKSP